MGVEPICVRVMTAGLYSLCAGACLLLCLAPALIQKMGHAWICIIYKLSLLYENMQ
jgi:hypothetical protein